MTQDDICKAILVAKELNIIVLSVMGRGGSYFIQSLFDSHPEVVSFPIVYESYEFFPNIEQNIDDMVMDFLNKKPDIFSTHMRNDFFIQATELYIDKDKWALYMKGILEEYVKTNELTHKNFFEFAHIALGLTLKKDISKIKYIFIHYHNYSILEFEKIVDFLMRSYPNFYHLIGYKDIMHSMLSFFKVHRRLYNSSIPRRYNSMSLTHKNLAQKDKYHKHLITLVDNSHHNLMLELPLLHKLQENAMRQVANYLNIKYDKCLCQSTFLSIRWEGNATDGKLNYGFDINRSKLPSYEKESKLDIVLAKFYVLETQKVFKSACYKSDLTLKDKSIVILILFVYFLIPGFLLLDERERKTIEEIKRHEIQNRLIATLPLPFAKKIIFLLKLKRVNVEYYKRKYNAKAFLNLIRLLRGNFTKMRLNRDKIDRLKEEKK